MSEPESLEETALEVFGRRVRSLRQDRGFSLLRFAEKTGIHRAHLSQIELGRVNVTLDTLFCLADALNTDASQLLSPLDGRPELYIGFRKRPS